MNSLKISTDMQKLKSFLRSLSLKGVCVQDDSRKIKEGDVFVAVRGLKNDGHLFIKSVCEKKARALIVEDSRNIPKNFKGFVFQIESTKKMISGLMNHYYNFPSEKMFCVGITGTNGKTTTAYLLEHLFSKGGWKTGVIGTTGCHIGGEIWESHLTTPSAVELQDHLWKLHNKGAQAVVMEVSSIGLDQQRIDGVYFNTVVFTNFTQDHLDYHKNMDQYFKAKMRLLKLAQIQNHCTVIFNADDEKFQGLSKHSCQNFISYGEKGKDFRYKVVQESLEGVDFDLYYQGKTNKVRVPLIGSFNVSNTVSALSSAVTAGFSLDQMISHLTSFKGIPGRLQRVETSQPVYVFIDYAHTHIALESVLKSLKQASCSSQKIITVFGCGGNRDQGKRRKMGEMASLYSDWIVVTSDNPRFEDPQQIMQGILQGVSLEKKRVFILENRREAIKKGLELAGTGDIVLIAGKGHERFQMILDEKNTF